MIEIGIVRYEAEKKNSFDEINAILPQKSSSSLFSFFLSFDLI